MSCYLPMIEKLKRSSKPWVDQNKPTVPPKKPITPPDEDRIDSFPVPKRDPSGLSISQGVGQFPRDVQVTIRHQNPTLGLSDVAFQRLHQNHSLTPDQYKEFQRQIDRSGNQKGVLSLGLPENLKPKTLFRKASNNEVVHMYETLGKPLKDEANNNGVVQFHRKTKMPSRYDKILANNSLDSGDFQSDLSFASSKDDKSGSTSSGTSCGSRSPQGFVPTRGPPPKYLLPARLVPSPPQKLHPELSLCKRGKRYEGVFD